MVCPSELKIWKWKVLPSPARLSSAHPQFLIAPEVAYQAEPE